MFHESNLIRNTPNLKLVKMIQEIPYASKKRLDESMCREIR